MHEYESVCYGEEHHLYLDGNARLLQDVNIDILYRCDKANSDDYGSIWCTVFFFHFNCDSHSVKSKYVLLIPTIRTHPP